MRNPNLFEAGNAPVPEPPAEDRVEADIGTPSRLGVAASPRQYLRRLVVALAQKNDRRQWH
jgi:hypothetical protein